jgi:hypothetical protein
MNKVNSQFLITLDAVELECHALGEIPREHCLSLIQFHPSNKLNIIVVFAEFGNEPSSVGVFNAVQSVVKLPPWKITLRNLLWEAIKDNPT